MAKENRKKFPSGMLQGDMAAACFFRLLEGERGSRAYVFADGGEFGYFFVAELRRWVVFDNRMATCFVEVCESAEKAEKLLEDGNELLAA